MDIDQIQQACPALHQDILREVFDFYALDKPEERDASYQANLSNYARVCRSWYQPAQECLWRHLGDGLSRSQGYYAPEMISALKQNSVLSRAVRTLHITTTLDASLWRKQYANEGECFADIVACCPNIRKLTVASFEVASKERVLQALRGLHQLKSFEIRVYLESDRRSKSFSALIPYFDWTTEVMSSLIMYWPMLESFSVIHQPKDSYHIRPDSVLLPAPRCFTLPMHRVHLTKLSLRETLVDDRTLFHLSGEHRLTELTLMSCQGITSSAITKAGLLRIIQLNASTLRKLCIMTPWLAVDTVPPILDEAIKNCSKVTDLVVAGQDVTDQFFLNLHPDVRVQTLGITDFELISPQGLYTALQLPQLSQLKEISVWQRNGGSNNGHRLTYGFLEDIFHSIRHWKLVTLLIERGIHIGTGWESRLISGGSIAVCPLRREDTYAMPHRLSLMS